MRTYRLFSGSVLATVVLVLGNSFHTCHANSDVLVSDLLEWLRANGAYINEKLVVRHVVPDDPSSPRGIFATADMDAGEKVCSIPSKVILKSSKEDLSKNLKYPCGTIKAVMEAMSGDDITPYGRYLLAQPKFYIAKFWSEEARYLFMDMLKSTRTQEVTVFDELPPHGIDDAFHSLEQVCHGDTEDPFFLQAAMLVTARGDYDFMIPFYDMINHHNGKYNVRHITNPHKADNSYRSIDETGIEILTSEVIQAGDELKNSYNRCNICQARYDWFGTPEMFLDYGFVESMPQRWLFDFARVKFDLDWKDGDEATGEVVVNFLVPPSQKGMSLLQEELTRLESFSKTYRNNSHEDEDVPKYEWDSLWQYYDALYDAISKALQSDAALSDDVWDLDDNWWVKDGSLTASDVTEHYVLPMLEEKSSVADEL